MRIGQILVVIFVACVAWGLLGFPQPWGFMLLAAISITAQLSAPWLSQQERSAAIANKNARILWALMTKGEAFDANHLSVKPGMSPQPT